MVRRSKYLGISRHKTYRGAVKKVREWNKKGYRTVEMIFYHNKKYITVKPVAVSYRKKR